MLWLAVYRQSICSGAEPIQAHEKRLLCNRNLSAILRATFFSTRWWLNRLGLCQLCISHIKLRSLSPRANYRTYFTFLKILPFSVYTSPPYFRTRQSRSLFYYTTAKFKPFIFSVSGISLSYVAKTVWALTWKVENCVQIVHWCTTWNLVLLALYSQEVGVCRKLTRGKRKPLQI
jgi:hypothetical protein